MGDDTRAGFTDTERQTLDRQRIKHIQDVYTRVEGMEPAQERRPQLLYEETLIPPRERCLVDNFFKDAEERRELREKRAKGLAAAISDD